MRSQNDYAEDLAGCCLLYAHKYVLFYRKGSCYTVHIPEYIITVSAFFMYKGNRGQC